MLSFTAYTSHFFFCRVVVNRQANKLWFIVKVVPQKPLGDVKVCEFCVASLLSSKICVVRDFRQLLQASEVRIRKSFDSLCLTVPILKP